MTMLLGSLLNQLNLWLHVATTDHSMCQVWSDLDTFLSNSAKTQKGKNYLYNDSVRLNED